MSLCFIAMQMHWKWILTSEKGVTLDKGSNKIVTNWCQIIQSLEKKEYADKIK